MPQQPDSVIWGASLGGLVTIYFRVGGGCSKNNRVGARCNCKPRSGGKLV